MILYLVGGYVKKYGQSENKKKVRFLIGYCIAVFLTWLSKLVIELITLCFLGEVRAGNYFISYKSPLIVMAAVCLLLFFEKINIPPLGIEIIRFLSPMAFGVYLIHGHPLVFEYVMKNRFVKYAAFPVVFEVLAVIGTSLLINFICYIIDFIRLQLFKGLHIRQRLDAFENRVKEKVLR